MKYPNRSFYRIQGTGACLTILIGSIIRDGPWVMIVDCNYATSLDDIIKNKHALWNTNL